jgi:hypothetical protein
MQEKCGQEKYSNRGGPLMCPAKVESLPNSNNYADICDVGQLVRTESQSILSKIKRIYDVQFSLTGGGVSASIIQAVR